MKAFILLILSTLACSISAQVGFRECATVPEAGWAAKLRDKVTDIPPLLKQAAPRLIPYQIHLFKKSDSTSVLSLQDVYKEIDTVNALYANANMLFYECAPPEIIFDDSLYNFQSSEEPVLLNQHYTADILNLYFPNTAKSGNTLVCGYSRYPPSVDVAIIAAGCATNGSTLPHEIGHYFGLMHTHETFYGPELVNGTNCSVAGDLICDTPADPVLDYATVSLSCAYTGTVTDGNGMLYTPDVTNIMSYSRKECRFFFSPMQYAVLNATSQSDRAYLACSYGVGLRELGTDVFTVFPNPGSAKLQLRFTPGTDVARFELYNTLGELLIATQVEQNDAVHTGWIPAGVYLYRIHTASATYEGKWIRE